MLDITGFGSLTPAQRNAAIADYISTKLGHSLVEVASRTYSSELQDGRPTEVYVRMFESPRFEGVIHVVERDLGNGRHEGLVLGWGGITPQFTGTRAEVRLAWAEWSQEHPAPGTGDKASLIYSIGAGTRGDSWTLTLDGNRLSSTGNAANPNGVSLQLDWMLESSAVVGTWARAIIDLEALEIDGSVTQWAICRQNKTGVLFGPAMGNPTPVSFPVYPDETTIYLAISDGEAGNRRNRLFAGDIEPVPGAIVDVHFPAATQTPIDLTTMKVWVAADRPGKLYVGEGPPVDLAAGKLSAVVDLSPTYAVDGSVLLRYVVTATQEEHTKTIPYVPGLVSSWIITSSGFVEGLDSANTMKLTISASETAQVYILEAKPEGDACDLQPEDLAALIAGGTHAGQLLENGPVFEWSRSFSEAAYLLLVPVDKEPLFVTQEYEKEMNVFVEVVFGDGESEFTRLTAKIGQLWDDLVVPNLGGLGSIGLVAAGVALVILLIMVFKR